MGNLKELLSKRENDIARKVFPALELKESDPIKWEVLYTRLAGLVQNSKETAKMISASPVVREMGECIFALFTPEGDSIALSDGLLIHIASMGSAIKWMLKNDYEEIDKIREGDIFFNNDPHIGGAHSPDQLLVAPIFHEGKCIGWAGGLTHVPETGATEPGGSTPNALSRFDEGIYWPCLRVGDNWELSRNIERIVERGTRTSVWWILDQRAKMAGIRLICDGVLSILKEYGTDFYLKAIYEYIEDTRAACVKRLRQTLFPGKYRAVGLLDVPFGDKAIKSPIDVEAQIILEMTLNPEGEIFIDFDGTSPPGRHAFNATKPCTIGNMISFGMQYLFYDIKYNQGIAQTLTEDYSFNIPSPSAIDPGDITYATSLFAPAFCAFSVISIATSRAAYPAGYREAVHAGQPLGNGMRCGGTDQYGRKFGGTIFELTAGGFPASAVMDGMDACYQVFNPAGDCGDAEQWERAFPVVYLGRGIWCDSGGYGKYRGGCGLQSLYMVYGTDDMHMAANASADRTTFGVGIMGGYPTCASYRYIVSDTNLIETAAAKKPIPHGEGEDSVNPEWREMIKGKDFLTDAATLSTPMKSGDLWLHFTGSAGGYGDPIERNPELIKRDLELGLTTVRSAEKNYGVKVDPVTFEIDRVATEELRKQKRAERLARAIPAAEYINKTREKIAEGDIPPIPKLCLNDSMKNSAKFRKEFKEFWNLPDSFERIP
jgi:acetone carboxylase alpha subunit